MVVHKLLHVLLVVDVNRWYWAARLSTKYLASHRQLGAAGSKYIK